MVCAVDVYNPRRPWSQLPQVVDAVAYGAQPLGSLAPQGVPVSEAGPPWPFSIEFCCRLLRGRESSIEHVDLYKIRICTLCIHI